MSSDKFLGRGEYRWFPEDTLFYPDDIARDFEDGSRTSEEIIDCSLYEMSECLSDALYMLRDNKDGIWNGDIRLCLDIAKKYLNLLEDEGVFNE